MAKKQAKKESRNEKFQKEAFFEKKNAWLKYKPAEKKTIFKVAEDYKKFLFNAKTERESVKTIVADLKKNGYKELKSLKKLKSGDKVYKVIREKTLVSAVVGKSKDSLRILGSHIDSPRLDLKPNPLYEDSSVAMLKSHYYGGIKKYQWVNTPLAMHAVVHTKKGKVDLRIGEKEDDPKFIIPDLLPHLAKDQMSKNMREGITGENLHILVGSVPVADDDIKEKVKFTVLDILNKDHGMVEKDFLSADITFVPAGKPIDIGFDKGMIAGYGHDDHVCAYTMHRAQMEIKAPKNTVICFYADKEEIGSVGNTGAASKALEWFVTDLMTKVGSKKPIYEVWEETKALSCDVDAGVNPIFKEVHDVSNAAIMGHGITVLKYTGHGGKYSASEATSEYMSWLINILDKNKISWQAGELGRIDLGGGGTIAMFFAKYGMDIIDIGPAVYAMHSTQEVVSKVDVFEAYKAYKLFMEN